MVAAKGHLKKDYTGERKRLLRQRKKNMFKEGGCSNKRNVPLLKRHG